MTDISEKTLNKIKKEQLHPRPRWHFLTRNYFFWLMFILTTLMGGLTFSMIVLITGELDWDIYSYLGISLPKAVVMSLPYLWIALLIFFLFVTYYNFIHTRKGYRYRFVFIFLISLFLSAVLGYGFYQYGWTEIIERQLRLRIPGYHRMVYTTENQWMHPEKGLLGGKIIKIELEKGLVQLKDYLEREWKIDISQATVHGTMPLAENMEIKIIGKKLSKEIFKANEIRIMMRRFYQGGGRRPWGR